MTDFELSPSGQVRRAQILQLALHQARRQRLRRRAVRAGIACLAVVGVGLAVLQSRRPSLDPSRTSTAKTLAPNPQPSADHPVVGKITIERIETDPTIVDRLAVPVAAPKWVQIDDEQLSQELSKAGQPAGLARIGNQVTLIFHNHSP